MKRLIFILLLGIITYLSIGKAVYAQVRKETQSRQIIVTFKDKPKSVELLNISRNRKKSRLKFPIAGSRAMVFESKDANLKNAIDELKLDPNVESAVADIQLDLLYVTNDPAIRATPVPGKPQIQWGMYNLNLAGAGRTAWDVSKGSSQITVAVLDSGVDSQHPDLSGKLVSLVDCTGTVCQTVSSMSADANNLDASHGTHVAGIIGAATDNNIGVAGSGFNTTLMPIKIRNNQGEMPVSSFLNGIRYAADHNAKILNMSLGALLGNLDGPIVAQINDALNYAWGKGVLLVAAAGNCGWDTSHHVTGGDPCDVYDSNGNFVKHAVNEKYYPAAGPNVISVAATDINNQMAEYSEHNDPSNPAIGNWISVAAPGGMFISDANKELGIANTWPGGAYFYNLGTSSAAPHVSGIAALILAKKTTLTNAQLKSVIEQTANRNIMGGRTNFGMVNALGALDSVNVTATPTISPTSTMSQPSPTEAAGKQGDGNGDGLVDGLDYVIWLNHYGLFMRGPVYGDYDSSGIIDGVDYVIWRNNYGK